MHVEAITDSPSLPARACRPGFTLVELLVVIGIIAVLVAMLMPVFRTATGSARRVVCQNNLRQIVVAVRAYAQDNDSVIPIWHLQFRDPSYHTSVPGGVATADPEGQFFQNGRIWRYLQNEDVYRCPEYPERRTGTVNPVWGYPPAWTYSINGQPAITNGNADWSVKRDAVRPSPTRVMMMMEQSPNDYYAFDNGVMLFWWPPSAQDDSLGYFHKGGGNVAYYDDHIEWMLRDEYTRLAADRDLSKAFFGGAW